MHGRISEEEMIEKDTYEINMWKMFQIQYMRKSLYFRYGLLFLRYSLWYENI